MKRQLLGVRIAGWALVVLGSGHLVTVAADNARVVDAATAEAMAALGRAEVSMGGPTHTLAQLFLGYSLLMGLMVVAFGAAVVVAAPRMGGAGWGGLRPLLATVAVVSLIGLGLSVWLMPLPPIIGLSVALIAALWGLTGRGEGA
jgi:hypothetical protein